MVLFMVGSYIFLAVFFIKKKNLIFLLLYEEIVCIISPLAKIMNNFVPEICAMHRCGFK